MAYVQGFVAAVPTAKKEIYREHAEKSAPMFKKLGAQRQVEAWADNVPDGKVTDFKRSVQARDDESVVFAWLEYPDRATYDTAKRKMTEDPSMADMGEMPFDGTRMIFGGFDPIVDVRNGPRGKYADGYVVPVPTAKKDAYRAHAIKGAEVFKDHGALRIVEAWGDDVPEGKITDFRRSVKAQPDESVVFGFVEWPDKKTREEAWKKLMEDPRMQPTDMPFDGKRMFWGGFTTLVDR
jgi:uncharacterized protein YbaA (DUF1428 family)